MKPSYTAKMKAIRPFVRFNFKRPENLGRANKVKITKYYNFIESNKGKYIAVKPPRGAKFEKVQTDLNSDFQKIPRKISNTDFKVLFLDKTDAGSNIEYSKRVKGYVLRSKKRKRRKGFIPFKDREAFALDPKGYTEKITRGYPKNTRFRVVNKDRTWVSQTGTNEQGDQLQGGLDQGAIGDFIVSLDSDSGSVEGYVLGLEYDF